MTPEPVPPTPPHRPLRQTLRVLPALLWALGIWTLSSQADLPGGELDLPYLDKIAHAGLFALLAGLSMLAGAPARLAWILATGWGVIDEFHQAFVPLRTPELADLAADSVGALLAVLAVKWLAPRRHGPGYPERSKRRSQR